MSQKRHLPQISNIRSLAIFIVVTGHSIILYSSSWDLYQTSVTVPFLDSLKQIIDILQMPLFFSLSGYLFAFTHQKRPCFLHLLRDKIRRLLVPYVIIGTFWLLPIRLIVGFPSYHGINFYQFLMKLITSEDVGHLWFLPALFLMFALSEMVLTIAEKIPCIKKIPSICLCAVALALYMEGYRIGLGYAPLLGAYNYLIWFSLGYLMNQAQGFLKKLYSVPLIKWGLLSINIVLFSYYCSTESVRVLTTLLLRAMCIINVYGAMPCRTCRIVEKVDRNSFGIYLFHSPLIYITFACIPNAYPAIVLFVNLVIFGAIAYGLTELVRKCKLRIIIGE